MVAPRVFLDFAHNNEPLGRVIFELYNVSAPKTSENFRALCTGEKGLSAGSQLPLYYKNSIVHRVIPDFMIQGGDFTKRNGTGGESIYGGMFADEDLSRPVDAAGLLVMANRGPNTNSSQFFITLRACPHLNGKHVVFGRVIRGFDEVVKRIADVQTDEKDRPSSPVVVVNCGELELRRPPKKTSKKAAASSEEAASESEDDRGRMSRRRARSHSSARSSARSVSRSRSRSRSSDTSDSEEERRRRKELKKARKREKKEQRKSKKRKHRSSRSPEAGKADGIPGVTREETEEEYDARLEREENERLEADRLRKLAEMKARYAGREESKEEGGIRYKGRGRMKYIDPESRSRHE